VRSGNKVRSAEKQTPITPLAINQFRLRGLTEAAASA
jgi:D-alanyl-D-alanine carboxypeptidase/D-alanyl-D-alanine-endopeptidase (penicillin-binding protein 4)